MASENETFDEVLRCMQNDIVHFVGKPVKHSRDLLQEYHDRFKAAHKREVAELKRQRKEALAIASDIDKCASIERHTDAMLKKNEVIVCLRKEVAELRGCLRMAVVNARIARTCCASGRECDNCGQSCDARKWNKVIVATKGASND